MTETRNGNTFSKFTAIHRAWLKLRGGSCCYKTLCMRIFARRTFLPFRYCSIHVKIHVLLTYSAVKRRVSMGSRNLVSAILAMSGSPTFQTKKEHRKIERGEFITPPRPTGRRSKYMFNYIVRARDRGVCNMICWLQFDLHKKALTYSPKSLYRHHGVSIYDNRNKKNAVT